jgi:putative component of membrane protein insertase Oxa1/YidC/SpoIIIJ protein YidD
LLTLTRRGGGIISDVIINGATGGLSNNSPVYLNNCQYGVTDRVDSSKVPTELHMVGGTILWSGTSTPFYASGYEIIKKIRIKDVLISLLPTGALASIFSSSDIDWRFESCIIRRRTVSTPPLTVHQGKIVFVGNNGMSSKCLDTGATVQGGRNHYTNTCTFAPNTVDYLGVGLTRENNGDSNFTIINNISVCEVFFNIGYNYITSRVPGAVTKSGNILNEPVKHYLTAGTYTYYVPLNHYIIGLTGLNFWGEAVDDFEALLGESGVGAITARTGNNDYSQVLEITFTIATAKNVELRIYGAWYDAANRLAFGYVSYSPDGGNTRIRCPEEWIDGKVRFQQGVISISANDIRNAVTVTENGKLITGNLIVPPVSKVINATEYDSNGSVIGDYVEVDPANVRANTPYGSPSAPKTGLSDHAPVNKVAEGTTYDNDTKTGTMPVPLDNNNKHNTHAPHGYIGAR